MPAKVLVVDFDRFSAETTAGDLAAAGVGVETVTGPAALEGALGGTQAAIVIVEPVLAGFDGFDVVRRFKNPPEGRAPQVFTASRLLRGARYKATARDAGADLVLERPQDDPLMLIAVGKLLSPAGSVRQTAAVRVATATGAAARSGPVALADPELDTLVDQMFDACFDPAADAAAAQDTALARTMRGRRGRTDSGTADLLASLSEIENSMPVAPSASSADAAEIETSVPLAPPPRPREDVALDEMLDRITSNDASRPAPPAVSAPPIAAGPVAVPASDQGQRSGTTGTSAAPCPTRRSRGPMIAAACAGLAIVGGSAWYFTRPAEPASSRAPAGADAVARAADAASSAPMTTGVSTPAETVDPDIDASGTPTASPPAPTTGGATPAEAVDPDIDTSATSTDGRPGSPPSGRGQPTSARGTAAPAGTGAVPEPAAPSTAALVMDATAEDHAIPVGTTLEASPPAIEPSVSETAARRPEPVVVSEDAPGQAPGTPDPEPPSRTVAENDAAQIHLEAGIAESPPELITASRVAPVYPPAARRLGISATVTLAVTVRPDGSVASSSLLNESVARLGFAEAAKTAVARWRFRPGTRAGQPVESQTRVTVRFTAR